MSRLKHPQEKIGIFIFDKDVLGDKFYLIRVQTKGYSHLKFDAGDRVINGEERVFDL